MDWKRLVQFALLSSSDLEELCTFIQKVLHNSTCLFIPPEYLCQATLLVNGACIEQYGGG
jgi:hypothetical protein